MRRYTLDASGLLRYFVDALPSAANEVFHRAVDGECLLSLPAIAAAEAMYVADNRASIAGVELDGSPRDVVDLLAADLPIVLAPADVDVLEQLVHWQEEFPTQLHDGMIVASHVVQGTEAIVTSDARIADRAPTVWA